MKNINKKYVPNVDTYNIHICIFDFIYSLRKSVTLTSPNALTMLQHLLYKIFTVLPFRIYNYYNINL